MRGHTGIPTTVMAADESTAASTPRSSNRKTRRKDRSSSSEAIEVDAFDNPTELFQWINYGNFSGATKRVLEHPIEAKTWIVSKGEKRHHGKDGRIKWRYLPLHMICMKPNPPEQLLRALMFSYPKAAAERDHAGNLPIHYLLSEGCEDNYAVQLLLEMEPDCMHKRDNKGRSLLEIVSEGYRTGKLTKDAMVNMMAVLRQFTLDQEAKESVLNFTSGYEDEWRREERDATPAFGFSTEGRDQSHPVPENIETQVKQQQREQQQGRSRSRRRSSNPVETREAAPNGDSSNVGVDNASRSSSKGAEEKLEYAIAERDVLRESISRVQEQSQRQEMALVAMNKQLSTNAAELLKSKEKVQRKREQSEDLQKRLKDCQNKLADARRNATTQSSESVETIKAIKLKHGGEVERLKKERDDKFAQLKAQSDEKLGRLESELEQLRKEKDKEAQDAAARETEAQHKIFELMQTAANENHERKVERDKLTEEKKALEEQVTGLQQQVDEDPKTIEIVKAESQATERRLKSRIASLERELLEALGATTGSGDVRSRTSELLKIESERDALQEMNASLQEHVEQLKKRCDEIQESQSEMSKLRDDIQSVEKELLESRRQHAACLEELDDTKSKSLISESRLQTTIAKLEKDLLMAISERDQHVRASSTATQEETRLDEEKRSLQRVNLSLQNHVSALKEKCYALETSLDSSRAQNTELLGQLKAARESAERPVTENDIGGRQQELKSEFQSLLSLVSNLSNEGSAKSLHSLSTNEAVKYQEKLEDQMQQIVDLSSARDKLLEEIRKLRSEMETAERTLEVNQTSLRQSEEEKARLQAELRQCQEAARLLEKECSQLRLDKDEARRLGVQKQSYEKQLKDLKLKFETVKDNNSSLREIIARNNKMYLGQVQALGKEIADLKRVNGSLHEHVHELSLENEEMRNGLMLLSPNHHPPVGKGQNDVFRRAHPDQMRDQAEVDRDELLREERLYGQQ